MSKISVVITSDPQYPWTDKTDSNESESDSTKEARSEALITEQYEDINSYVSQSGNDVIVLVNGDLTAFGHGYQRTKISNLLGLLNAPVRWGLGNHDIENNYRETANNGAATDMMRMFINHYTLLSLTNKSWDATVTYAPDAVEYKGSFCYSWDDGDFHFIQLQNFPGMADKTYNKTVFPDNIRIFFRWDNSLTWIKKVIASAAARGKYIIINVHKPNTWDASTLDSLKEIFEQYKSYIKVVFAGHYHKQCGFRADYKKYMGGNFPVCLSGSASQRTYLICEIHSYSFIAILLVTNNSWKKRTVTSVVYLSSGILPGIFESVNYKIVPAVDVEKSIRHGDGETNLTIWEKNTFNNQFQLIQDPGKGSNVFQIKSVQSGKIIAWNERTDSQVFLYANEYKDGYYWKFELQDSGLYVISNYKNSDLVLDVSSSGTENGTKIQIYKRNDTAAQHFMFEKVVVVDPLPVYPPDWDYETGESGGPFTP